MLDKMDRAIRPAGGGCSYGKNILSCFMEENEDQG
jgi:hypothetical protein